MTTETNDKMKALAREASALFARHARGVLADAGFDAGEFSAPAHFRALEAEIVALAARHGVSVDDVLAAFAAGDVDGEPESEGEA